MVGARFEKLHFDKDHLIIEALELLEECVDERNGFGIGVFLEV